MEIVLELRHYQSTAIDKSLEWFANEKEKPLIVLPTGTGKSLVQAGLIQRIIEDAPHVRIICATHSKELVSQNHAEIMGIWPMCPAGIYSAGLGKRDRHAQILFAGIQSIYSKVKEIGHADLIIVDEAHSISRKAETRWGKFFADMKSINPNVQILGLTATDYRLDSGNLTPHTFNGIAYEYPIIEAITEGYLCEIISAPVATHLRTEGVHKRGGEYIAGELERAVSTDALINSCCDEIVAFGADRRSWLVFAAGNDHARKVTDRLIALGIDAKCVTMDTPRDARDTIVADHKAGRLKCLVNNMIFTTGYNNPMLDLIACLRPTQSAGLWVQMVGRGMRLFNGKPNCLLLDFGHNLDRHGPIDQIKGKNKEETSGNGEAPRKQCPKCFEPVYAAVMICPGCGHEFPPHEIDISTKASTSAVLSIQQTFDDYKVLAVTYKRNIGKDGKPDTLRVTYMTFAGAMSEFICFDHKSGYARDKASAWARIRGHSCPDVETALQIAWPQPEFVTAKKDGKYWKIREVIFPSPAN